MMANLLDKQLERADKVIYIWSGTGTTNAPLDVPMGSIGFDGDCSNPTTDNVYVYDANNRTWRDTTQNPAGFFGV